jgi:hypothetical protein
MIPELRETIDWRNSRSGMIGSSTLRSWTKNSTPSPAPAAARPRITGEVHGYVVPPHTATSRRLTTEATRRAAPR